MSNPTLQPKRYRLLKDLPDAKAGTPFIKSKDGRTYDYTSSNGAMGYYQSNFVENNLEWFEEISAPAPVKQEGKERIGVGFIQKTSITSPISWYKMMTTQEIPPSKYKPIKEAIEQVLNDDTKKQIPENIEAEFHKVVKELEVTDKLLNDRQRLLDAIPECPAHGKCIPHALDWIDSKKSKIYTKNQYEDAVEKGREEGFNAAREEIARDKILQCFFPTYNDYKQSLDKVKSYKEAVDKYINENSPQPSSSPAEKKEQGE